MTANTPTTRHEAQQSAKTASRWHALSAGFLGESFDAMDASMYFIAMYPALSDLLKTRNDTEIGWIGSIILAVFMLGWAAGGIFFGMLADHIGRAKTMMITILVYSVATGLCALSHNWTELAIYRFFVGCGIGGEIGLGTVIISEFWNNRSRLWATSALESSFYFGVLFTAGFNALLGNMSWRWLFVVGLLPALLTLYIRAKLKEPESFEQVKQHRQRLRRKPREHLSANDHKFLRCPLIELFIGETRQHMIATVVLASVAIIGYWSCVSWIPPWINQITGTLAVAERSTATTVLSIGGIFGAALTPLLLTWLGRARALQVSFGICLVSTLLMFLTIKSYGLPLLAAAFIVGTVASIQFVTLCIYIPEAFPTRILATASCFTFSAGRILAALFALGGGHLITLFSGSYAMASATLSLVYGVGFIGSFFLPQTNGKVKGVDITIPTKVLSARSVADSRTVKTQH